MEHAASCKLCTWQESWTTHEAAQASAVWQIYTDHYDTWISVMGSSERPPTDTMPEDLGRRLEAWESQL